MVVGLFAKFCCFQQLLLSVAVFAAQFVYYAYANLAQREAGEDQSIAEIIARIERRPAIGWSHDDAVQVISNTFDQRIPTSETSSGDWNSIKSEENDKPKETHHKAWMNSAFREMKLIKRAIRTYHQKTCIKFVPRTSQYDYLYIIKGYGCYSQVGRVRGRQELSLGYGCLFHEIAVHELMHALGFWYLFYDVYISLYLELKTEWRTAFRHEHSRSDRDHYIRIRWENIHPRMRGQFSKVSAPYQDFLGEAYDYRSVMHYDSTAFSRNGRNTIESIQPGFTSVIGTAADLSSTDIRKVNKLYQCSNRVVITTTQRPATRKPTVVSPSPPVGPTGNCRDKFLDCPYFHRYCFRQPFYFVMKFYCPRTCRYCYGATHSDGVAGNEPLTKDAKPPEVSFRQTASFIRPSLFG